MAKRTWIYIDGEGYEVVNGELIAPVAPMVMPDIKPYKSMIDGREITSRSAHREHLKNHGCIEIGNEIPKTIAPRGIPDVNPEGRKELIRAQIDALRHDDLKRMLKRDLDRIKWNSRDR